MVSDAVLFGPRRYCSNELNFREIAHMKMKFMERRESKSGRGKRLVAVAVLLMAKRLEGFEWTISKDSDLAICNSRSFVPISIEQFLVGYIVDYIGHTHLKYCKNFCLVVSEEKYLKLLMIIAFWFRTMLHKYRIFYKIKCFRRPKGKFSAIN